MMMMLKKNGGKGSNLVLLFAAVLLCLSTKTVTSFVPVTPTTTTITTKVQQQRRYDGSMTSSSSSSITTRSTVPAGTVTGTCTSSTSTKLNALLTDIVTSPEPIHTAFSFATFGPQPFWLFLIFLPKADITKKLMGRLDIVIFFALVHFFIVTTSIIQPGGTAPMAEFNDVFNPNGDPEAAFLNMVQYPNFVAEEWSHVLTWDFFIGRWIWLDGLRRGVFTSHSVLFCNLIGPPGLLLHWMTCLITKKEFFENEVPDTIEEDV